MIKVHSIQSLGTLDGPGVRFVAFLQGCPLRCKCCHNPDTWAMTGGREVSAQDLYKQVLRYKEYFGSDGGITVSGGEPLLQAKDLRELFLLCKEHGIEVEILGVQRENLSLPEYKSAMQKVVVL